MVIPSDTQHIINQLNSAANGFSNLGGFNALVASGVLSPVVYAIKKLCSIDHGEVMLWLLGALSLVSGFVVYLITQNPGDPTVVAFLGVVTFIGTQPFYKLLFRPFFKWLEGQFATAKQQVEAQKNPASVPAEGLPPIGK